MSDETPTSFRLSADAKQALARIAERRGQSKNRAVEKLILDTDAQDQQADLRARVEDVEERLTRLEETRHDPPSPRPRRAAAKGRDDTPPLRGV